MKIGYLNLYEEISKAIFRKKKWEESFSPALNYKAVIKTILY